MNRLMLIILILTMLTGCVFMQTHNVKVWALCYQDQTLLPNGMYQSNELQHMHCNKRRELQFLYKPGERPYVDVLKGMKEHSGD